jgi:DNA-binding MarR family transcriptional regulator
MNRKNVDTAELLEIFTGLVQVSRCCRQDEAFCEDVTFHQFLILDAVAKNRELNMADLHKILAVEKSTTTRLLSPLIRKGLLTRHKDPLDFRAVRLTLTGEGSSTYTNVRLCLAKFIKKVSDNIPAGRKNDVLEAVRTFILAIKHSTAEGTCCK